MTPLSPLHGMLAKIGRERHAKRVNRIINDPSVLPWVQGAQESPIDLTPSIQDQRNILLMGQHGGTLFHQHFAAIYEAHIQVLPAGRGPWCKLMSQASLYWMFCKTDAMEIMARIPTGNPAVRALVKSLSFRKQESVTSGWTYDGKEISADVFAITLQEWAGTSPGLVERGEWMARKVNKSLAEPTFILQEGQARYLGVLYEMAVCGMPSKGVMLYNRWAAMASSAQIEICSIKPFAVIVNETVVVVRDTGEFYRLEDNNTLH